MARFDVYRLRDGGLALDCQANFLDDIGTRFVVPLMPLGDGPPPNQRLNPAFEIEGEPVVLVPQFATAIRTRELAKKIGSLADEHIGIVAAIDVLIGNG
jgi:toxin CcdB